MKKSRILEKMTWGNSLWKSIFMFVFPYRFFDEMNERTNMFKIIKVQCRNLLLVQGTLQMHSLAEGIEQIVAQKASYLP